MIRQETYDLRLRAFSDHRPGRRQHLLLQGPLYLLLRHLPGVKGHHVISAQDILEKPVVLSQLLPGGSVGYAEP